MLVTGATGYIGSHVVAELLAAGHEVVGIDNFSNSHILVGQVLSELPGSFRLHRFDVRDGQQLRSCLRDEAVDAVVHLAGVKSVAESMVDPLRYWSINVGGTTELMSAMQDTGVHRMVYSSSCTVYGQGDGRPITEQEALRPTNPYGRSKAAAEQLLSDAAAADPSWQVVALRYFNPAGAGPTVGLGDNPTTSTPNLVPAVLRAAASGEPVEINGVDYDTADGTCERDYLHIADLVDGHIAALNRTADGTEARRGVGFEAVNLGTGTPTSVLGVIAAAEHVTGTTVSTISSPRRPGDATSIHADPTVASHLLDWKAQRSIEEMVRSHWEWQQQAPR